MKFSIDGSGKSRIAYLIAETDDECCMLAGLALCGVKSIKLEISEDTDMARWLIKLRYSPYETEFKELEEMWGKKV